MEAGTPVKGRADTPPLETAVILTLLLLKLVVEVAVALRLAVAGLRTVLLLLTPEVGEVRGDLVIGTLEAMLLQAPFPHVPPGLLIGIPDSAVPDGAASLGRPVLDVPPAALLLVIAVAPDAPWLHDVVPLVEAAVVVHGLGGRGRPGAVRGAATDVSLLRVPRVESPTPTPEVGDEVIADGETDVPGAPLAPLPPESTGAVGVGAPVRPLLVIPPLGSFERLDAAPPSGARDVFRPVREVSADAVREVRILAGLPGEAGSLLAGVITGGAPLAMAPVAHRRLRLQVTSPGREIPYLGLAGRRLPP